MHGLDTATRKWHVVREDGRYDSCTVRASVATDDARIELAASWRQYVDSEVAPGDAIVCEEPLSLQNGKTSRVLAMAAGDIHLATFWPRAVLGDGRVQDPLGVRWVWADVSMWKGKIVGSGNADKQAIQDFVYVEYGVRYDEDDHADAHCLRDFGILMEGMGWHRVLSQVELEGGRKGKRKIEGLRQKDPAAAAEYDALLQTGVQHLTDWRMRARLGL